MADAGTAVLPSCLEQAFRAVLEQDCDRELIREYVASCVAALLVVLLCVVFLFLPLRAKEKEKRLKQQRKKTKPKKDAKKEKQKEKVGTLRYTQHPATNTSLHTSFSSFLFLSPSPNRRSQRRSKWSEKEPTHS